MKRLIAGAALALPLMFTSFTAVAPQANAAGLTIRLGNSNNYGYWRDTPRGRVWVNEQRRERIEDRRERREERRERIQSRRNNQIWIPGGWNYQNRGRIWVPGHYSY
jgi:hypothetical protein